MVTRRWMRDFRFALAMISGSGRIRNSRIAGVVVTAAVPRLRMRSDGSPRMPSPGLVLRWRSPRRDAADKVVLANAEEDEIVGDAAIRERRSASLTSSRAIGRRTRSCSRRSPGSTRATIARQSTTARRTCVEDFIEPIGERLPVGFERDPADMDMDQAFADRRRRRRLGAEIARAADRACRARRR